MQTTVQIGQYKVQGLDVDAKSRCSHWHSELDIVALRMPGDDTFYPCYACFEAIHKHTAPRWSRESFDQEEAILCGNCATTLSIRKYLDSENTCPNCQHAFNPGCAKHYQHYFE